MKWLVVSDSHGMSGNLYDVLESHRDIEGLFFLGDGLHDIEYLKGTHPDLKVYAVCGNCDKPGAPTEGIADCGGVCVLYTHGHMYGVKSALGPLCRHAKEEGAAVALYGHTHNPLCGTQEGVLLANPGALSHFPIQYGILTVENGVASFQLRMA